MKILNNHLIDVQKMFFIRFPKDPHLVLNLISASYWDVSRKTNKNKTNLLYTVSFSS